MNHWYLGLLAVSISEVFYIVNLVSDVSLISRKLKFKEQASLVVIV